MVVFERKPFTNSQGNLAFIGLIIIAHYSILLTIIKVKSKKQLNYVHYLVTFIFYIELCFFLLWTNDKLWIVFVYALVLEFLGLLLFFDAIPDWKDEQTELEMEEYDKNSNDPFYNLTHENLIQLKIENEITKQPINIGGKNTEITVE